MTPPSPRPDLDPARPSDLRHLFRSFEFRPRRRWGQHFLIDRSVLDRILAAADIAPEDGVMEVGAGAGALTLRLAESAGEVLAVEIDRRLQPILAETVGDRSNVRILFDDAMVLDWNALRGANRPWKFVANVPYYITAPLLVKALTAEPRFRLLVMLIQREVADRLTALPGGKTYGALSVLAAYYARTRFAFPVPASCFWPTPQVDSAVVVLDPKARDPAFPPAEVFFSVVRAAFGKRRKMLRNALSDDPHLGLSRPAVETVLRAAEIDGNLRGETLDLESFARLARAVSAWTAKAGREDALER